MCLHKQYTDKCYYCYTAIDENDIIIITDLVVMPGPIRKTLFYIVSWLPPTSLHLKADIFWLRFRTFKCQLIFIPFPASGAEWSQNVFDALQVLEVQFIN